MSEADDTFTYSDLLDCIALLRTRAYGRPLAELVALIGEHVMEGELKRKLRYLIRRGKLASRARGDDVQYIPGSARRGDQITELKKKMSREPWTGKWHVLTYDVPTTHDPARHRLARWLREMGFAPLGRSSWLSPYDWSQLLDRAILEWRCKGRFHYLGPTPVRALAKGEGWNPVDLWDLRGLADRYRRVADTCAGAPKGRTARDQRVRAKTLLAATRELGAIEREDPMLPGDALPTDWPREQALKSIERLQATVQRDIERPATKGA